MNHELLSGWVEREWEGKSKGSGRDMQSGDWDRLEMLSFAAAAVERTDASQPAVQGAQREGARTGRRARKMNSRYADDFVDDGRSKPSHAPPKGHDPGRAGQPSRARADSSKHKVS